MDVGGKPKKMPGAPKMPRHPGKQGMHRSSKQFHPGDEEKIRVGIMVAAGMTIEQIRATLINPNTGNPINAQTFREHFGEEAAFGKALANNAVAGALYAKALSDAPNSAAAAIFWLKTQADWKEKTISEVQIIRDAQELSDDQLAAIASSGGPGASNTETGEE